MDPEARAFEANGFVDTASLSHGMSRALLKFQKVINAVGGAMELKSAYRPPAYQLHLQQVWDKWAELRNNNDPACQDLRAQVGEEFARHHLIETQRPVSSSDHTRGMAFDATVLLPAHPRLRRRKVTLDALAHFAGLRRPDILHDPVHFKYVGGRIRRG
jgi:D-alanyl-D-alanine dipeptidase